MKAIALQLLVLLAAPAAADTLIVGNKGANSVSFIDLDSGETLATRATGPAPHEIAVSPDGTRAAVVEYGGNGILLFDVRSTARIERIDLGENTRPHGLLWLPDGRLVATTEGADSIVTVAPDARAGGERVAAIDPGGRMPHMVAVHGRDRAFVANMRSGDVTEVDLASGTDPDRFEVGGTPEGLAVSADGRRLWVADRDGATLSVFDTTTRERLRSVPTGGRPIRVALTPDGREAVVSNFVDGTLTVVDTSSFATRTVPVGGAGAEQVTILFSADGRRLYVAETARDTVAELDWPSGRVLRRISVGRQGDGLAISPVDAAPR